MNYFKTINLKNSKADSITISNSQTFSRNFNDNRKSYDYSAYSNSNGFDAISPQQDRLSLIADRMEQKIARMRSSMDFATLDNSYK